MISFEPSSLLYTSPILVDDPHDVTKNGKKFELQYSSEMQSNFQSKTLGIFGNTKTNEDFLFESKKKGSTILFNKICLFPCLTIYEATEIFALSLKLNVHQINIEFIDDEDICSNNSKLLKISKENLYTSYSSTNKDTYSRVVSIGYRKIKLHISTSKYPPITFYENTFYSNYLQIGSYVNDIVKNTQKQKIKNLKITPNISALSLVLVYNGDKFSIDIPKVFNLHVAGKRYSKIYIQSQKVDANEMNEREMQYVKTSTEVSNPFNGISALYETCSLYLGEEISNGVILQCIDICENSVITVRFTVIDSQLNYDEIKKQIKKWSDDNLQKYLEETCIDDCIYNIDFKLKNYIPFFGDVTSSVIIPDGSLDDIGEINILMNQNIPTVKFPTKTSIQFSMYAFNNINIHQRFNYLLVNKDFVTDNVIQRSLLPTCHAGINITTGFVAVSSLYAGSYEESLYHYSMIIGLFSKLQGSIESTVIKEEQSLKAIKKRAISINKKRLLKILYATDPVLFGERKVGRGSRPYSGLAQKSEQRVVPITKAEYEIVRKEAPESTVELQNQTFKAQRLYLLCPYEKTRFVNFHSIPNQVCIPRCTAKLSNKSQLNFCIKSLDARGIEVVKTVENQSITLYNPIITRGRKCKLPLELSNIFPSYICVKLPVGLNEVDKYYNDQFNGKRAFIIKRDTTFEKYEIWTEYNKDVDYILTLFAERTVDDVFMITTETRPLLFSEHDVIRNFFANCTVKTNAQLKFFDFVETITGKSLKNMYSMGINEILRNIYKMYNIMVAVVNNIIFGIVYNDKLFSSPNFYWQYNKEEEFIQITQLTQLMIKEKVKLPTLGDFNEKYIDELYIDYKSEKIRGINYKNIFSFTQASEIPVSLDHLPKIQFDFAPVFKANILNTGDEEVKAEAREKRGRYLRDLQNMYLFVYLIIIDESFQNEDETEDEDDIQEKVGKLGKKQKNIQNYKFDQEEFMKFLDENGFLGKEDDIQLCNDDGKFVSWRKSKISKESMESFLKDLLFVDIYTITMIIYQQLQQSLKLTPYEGEKIYNKIIT